MKNRIIKWVMVLAAASLVSQTGKTQGFVNLDFENADLSAYGAGPVPTASAIPGWTAYISGVPLTNIDYLASLTYLDGNNIQVDIMGTPIGAPPIQGDYYVYLQGSLQNPAAIGQTGTIPITAKSLVIWGSINGGGILGSPVSFNGNILPLSQTGQTGIYTADISAFAGQTGQLLFTSVLFPGGGGDFIDNIQFSTLPVPEPASQFLLFLGSGILFYVRTRRKRHSAPARL
jgi:PEP-CTERM motif